MPSIKLQISPADNGEVLVVINGEGFYRPQAQPGARVGIRIKGDDPVFDETLFSIGSGPGEDILPDGTFIKSKTVPKGKLNEDWGQDEIYALASVDGFGDFKSNIVKGNY